jgi:hypothetical protein
MRQVLVQSRTEHIWSIVYTLDRRIKDCFILGLQAFLEQSDVLLYYLGNHRVVIHYFVGVKEQQRLSWWLVSKRLICSVPTWRHSWWFLAVGQFWRTNISNILCFFRFGIHTPRYFHILVFRPMGQLILQPILRDDVFHLISWHIIIVALPWILWFLVCFWYLLILPVRRRIDHIVITVLNFLLYLSYLFLFLSFKLVHFRRIRHSWHRRLRRNDFIGVQLLPRY